MMESFITYIRNISVFLIFSSFIGLIMPNDKYKDYINLILGFILIFIVISPIPKVLNMFNDTEQLINKIASEINMEEIEAIPVNYTDGQSQIILATYKNEINNQIKNTIDNSPDFSFIEADIEVGSEEENYGTINKITIYVKEREIDEKSIIDNKPFFRIEPVKIEKKSIFDRNHGENEDNSVNEESENIKTLKKSFSDFYNLSYSNIYIIVQKKSEG